MFKRRCKEGCVWGALVHQLAGPTSAPSVEKTLRVAAEIEVMPSKESSAHPDDVNIPGPLLLLQEGNPGRIREGRVPIWAET